MDILELQEKKLDTTNKRVLRNNRPKNGFFDVFSSICKLFYVWVDEHQRIRKCKSNIIIIVVIRSEYNGLTIRSLRMASQSSGVSFPA